MDGWRCKTGRRVSKKSLGGDCRWVVSTGMLILRRKPCLLVGWMGEGADVASGQVRTNFQAHEIGDGGRQGPEQTWRTRRVTSESWECPV